MPAVVNNQQFRTRQMTGRTCFMVDAVPQRLITFVIIFTGFTFYLALYMMLLLYSIEPQGYEVHTFQIVDDPARKISTGTNSDYEGCEVVTFRIPIQTLYLYCNCRYAQLTRNSIRRL